jgi:hypothetical protein
MIVVTNPENRAEYSILFFSITISPINTSRGIEAMNGYSFIITRKINVAGAGIFPYRNCTVFAFRVEYAPLEICSDFSILDTSAAGHSLPIELVHIGYKINSRDKTINVAEVRRDWNRLFKNIKELYLIGGEVYNRKPDL